MALTAKQQRFVVENLFDLNATQAAIRAGLRAGLTGGHALRVILGVSEAIACAEAVKAAFETLRATPAEAE